MYTFKRISILFFVLIFFSIGCAQQKNDLVKELFEKHEYQIPMRDGTKLFTAVYIPRDKSEPHPILLQRTPYSVAPYGEDKYTRILGYLPDFLNDGFIFVFQDVRGRYMSEGEFDNMRPYIPNKTGKDQVDESTDTYDTIDWLVKNIENNNGKVGLWGTSYPGFYSIMGALDAHPNLVCVSPQAPISDWFIGDDMHHNGAFSLLMSFNFFKEFGVPRSGPLTRYPELVEYDPPDAYHFFLNYTPIKKINDEILKNQIPFWDSLTVHGTYDYFWKSRNNLQYMKKFKPAILIVGGWYDAEDMFGPLNIYKTIEKNDSDNNTKIVMGPWIHGGWNFGKRDSLGDFYFGQNTGDFFRKNILLPFFKYYLKGEGNFNMNDAYTFDTGKNEWDGFENWPPKNAEELKFYFSSGNQLSNTVSEKSNVYSEYTSDPFKPVPYTAKFQDANAFYNPVHLIEDQRYASSRPDVLVFETDNLEENVTIAGPISADLFVSTTGTDGDFVVKLIDVYPDNEKDPSPNPAQVKLGGYERLIRTEIFRGKFRNSYEKPEPFIPGKVTEIRINLNDAFHTFKPGHKIMIQVQPSYFPFFDVNPNTFCDIYNADLSKFQKAEVKLFHSKEYPSSVTLAILKK